MNTYKKSTRLRDRISLNLAIQARYRENSEIEWTEKTQGGTFSQIGAGFALNSPVEPGRLIHLTVPLPKNLRLYDIRLEQYEIWATIRYLRMLEPVETDKIRLEVGTAFIGKYLPSSYNLEPKTRYDLTPGLMKDGLWGVREIPRNAGSYARQSETRHPIETNISLDKIDQRGVITFTDEAETQNISESGAGLTTKLTLEAGQFVRLKHERLDIPLLAVVRGSRKTEDGDSYFLHLEFVTGKWTNLPF